MICGSWVTGPENFGGRKTVEKPGITGQPAKAAFLSSKLAVVSSADGQVYRSQDGGTTWQVHSVIKNGDFRDVSFPNETIGWLSGYGPPSYNDSLYRSEDGGMS